MRQLHLVVLLTSMLLIGLFFQPVLAYGGQYSYVGVASSDTRKAIDAARDALYIAYDSVLDAERAGADVTKLVGDLNAALELLNTAEDYYARGDNGGALSYATQSKSISDQVVIEAKQLKAQAIEAANQRRIIVGFSVSVIIIAICVGLFYGWKLYRQKSREKILKMRVRVMEEAEKEGTHG
jgi:hypothetical protein